MSSFGTLFRVTTFGESHGKAVGCIIDGCPSKLLVSEDALQVYMDRRRPGQKLCSPRQESDKVHILSGVENNITLGTCLSLIVYNYDTKPSDYKLDFPRPSHADLTYQQKYGIKASSGGGRASARETAARVAAGGVADIFLKTMGIRIVAFVSGIGDLNLSFDEIQNYAHLTRDQVDLLSCRCPIPDIQIQIENARNLMDSVGGCVTCFIHGLPAGLGDPVFDKFPALLAHAMMSIPATKGFEIGRGFEVTKLFGSQNNDCYDENLKEITNNSGGCVGGITNGNVVYFRVAFKPPASIPKPQLTCNYSGELKYNSTTGRHDPCVVIRAVPVVEAMAAIVVADFVLKNVN